jgi:CO/xanthine dehydrogenase Mo-binding subunit
MLNKEFSRKSFLKGGGAMIVGFSLAGLGGKAAAAEDPYASNTPTDLRSIDTFLTIHTDNTASLKAGVIELGQGSATGMLMIVAEELGMAMSQVKSVRPDSNVTPTTGGAGASQIIRKGGPVVRAAAAYAKQALLSLAATRLGVPASGLTISDGVVSGNGKSVTYGELIGGKLFNIQMPVVSAETAARSNSTAWALPPGRIGPIGWRFRDSGIVRNAAGLLPGELVAKPVSQYKLVGTRVPRVDIPDKVMGRHVYIHNVRVPGMLHGRVVWPRGQRVLDADLNVVSVDEKSIKNIPDARVVRRGNFVGVVASTEYAAIQAAASLKVTWSDPPAVLPGNGNLFKHMRELDGAGKTIQSYMLNDGNVAASLASAAQTISQTYSFPHNAQAPIGPCCAIADVTPNGARILSSTQGITSGRSEVAALLGLPADRVRLTYYEGSSSFGGTLIPDAMMAAAVMSQLVSKPVRVQLMRWDEHGWESYGPGVMTDIRGGIDASGKIVGVDSALFDIQGWAYWLGETTQLVGAGRPSPSSINGFRVAGGAYSTAPIGDQYNIVNRRGLVKEVPPLGTALRVGYFRSPGVIEPTFAAEQFFDELAYAAKMDPVAFRRQNISPIDTDRWLGVLNAVTHAANWKPRVAASNLSTANIVTGRGIALAPGTIIDSFVAMVADIEVNKKTGKIVVKHIYAAQDSGLAINPDLVENQMIGGIIQSTSRVLTEEVRFTRTNVSSVDWVSYPILRFNDAPKVTAIVVQRPDVPPRGAGEEAASQAPAAIANAFFDATGVRIRRAPLTPARVRATLKTAGVK